MIIEKLEFSKWAGAFYWTSMTISVFKTFWAPAW